MTLLRALVAFPGGPGAGKTGEVDDALAETMIAAGFAVSVQRLSDRLPKARFPDQETP